MTATVHELNVMIIGGGIGGLCLAQGLRRAGISVAVYERTEARTDWLQGYRIHINPYGSRALHDSLTPAAWQRFLDSVSVSGGGFGFATDQSPRGVAF
jgi:2-polyprenyl-6-methoxyphenol hydroxylase-like FAD-dependent oxidoreductase